MEVCFANDKLDSESIHSFCESSKGRTGSSCIPGGSFVNDLGHHLTESLNIEDDEDLVYKDNPNTEEDASEGNANDTGISGSRKCLIKSATFPFSSVDTSPSVLVHGQKELEGGATSEVLSCNADVKSTALSYSRSASLPTPLKLVSAIKGSREKLGQPPRKLSVTWSPDVYDPIPTAVSHVPSKGHRHRGDNRKNGKNKQKNSGKASRGSKGKERKQSRKHGGSSKRSFQPLEDSLVKTCSSFHPLDDDLTCSSGLPASAVDFDIGNPSDQFCGSSFLKKSITKLHFPVAEAT